MFSAPRVNEEEWRYLLLEERTNNALCMLRVIDSCDAYDKRIFHTAYHHLMRLQAANQKSIRCVPFSIGLDAVHHDVLCKRDVLLLDLH